RAPRENLPDRLAPRAGTSLASSAGRPFPLRPAPATERLASRSAGSYKFPATPRRPRMPFRLNLPLLAVLLAVAPAAAQGPRTVAESSESAPPSKHAEVIAFCEQLAKASPLVRLTDYGVSEEGRKLPLLIVADPPVTTPEEAARSGKL